jgi:hypothetical protein
VQTVPVVYLYKYKDQTLNFKFAAPTRYLTRLMIMLPVKHGTWALSSESVTVSLSLSDDDDDDDNENLFWRPIEKKLCHQEYNETSPK